MVQPLGIQAGIPVSLFGHPHWDKFSISYEGAPSGIRLQQSGPRAFSLDCDIRYDGPTGLSELKLDKAAEERLRTVDATTLPETDLASVPAPFRWWSNTYGAHSPAALIHDRFIGEPAPGDPGRPDGVSERHIDRYFRFMLQACDVPFFRRWLMWAAVALRTRTQTNLIGLISILLWLAITGSAFVGVAMLLGQGRTWAAMAALLIPIPASALWARQFGAGLMMAYVGVPCLLPPSVVSVPFLLLYVLVEAIGKQIGRSYRYLTSDAETIETS
ncbi:MAG: DUF1353 domain-containing protein [Acidimicrobiales bacterium]